MEAVNVGTSCQEGLTTPPQGTFWTGANASGKFARILLAMETVGL